MEKRTLGNTGMQVSVLGFGGSEIGYGQAAQTTVDRLLGSALDAGLNVIDTAECYRGSEGLIGRAVGHRRTDYYLFSKCGHAAGLPHPDWSPELIRAGLERSLQQLRTDYLDLLQLHSCSEATLRQGDVIQVLQEVQAAGKVRFIGYSGDAAAARYAVECGAFATLQTSVNVADQQSIELTLPLAQAQGIGVIAKRPVANAAWRIGQRPTDPYQHVYWDRLQKLQYKFLAGDLALGIGTALRFTLAQPAVATAIVGTLNPERWAENARLLEAGPLTEEQIAEIRERWQATAQPDWVGQV